VLASQQPVYGRAGNASRAIFERLKSVDLDGILIKKFNDIAVVAKPSGASVAVI
jgi:hypothetical protein